MLETINTQSQTVSANGIISLGNTTITDPQNKAYLENSNTVRLSQPGKYCINAIFNLSNSTSSPMTDTISIYNGTSAIGLPITVTVPETGSTALPIQKTVKVYPSYGQSIAEIQFITSTGATVSGVIVDVFKRS